jgi:predicted RNase H-like nuclease
MQTDQFAEGMRSRESGPGPELTAHSSQPLLGRQTPAPATAGLERTARLTRYKKRAGREATLRRVVTAGLAVRERRVRGQGLTDTDRNGPLPETRKRSAEPEDRDGRYTDPGRRRVEPSAKARER